MGMAEIYYFSGTGNSLVVARDIAGKINAKLTSVPSVMDRNAIAADAGVIGIVFPVYHAIFDGLPLVIERFAAKLENPGSKYIFAVCTCRGWSRVALTKLDDILRSRGGKIAAGFTVPMPDNSSPTTGAKNQKAFRNWKKKLEAVTRYINARKTGKLENTVLFNVIMAPLSSPLQKATIKLLNKIANTSGKTVAEILPLTDRNFSTDENCSGCGTCSKVCPVSNIEIIDKKPVWLNRCESCLACVNWCPKEAIHGGISFKNGETIRYRHPDVKVSEILRRDG